MERRNFLTFWKFFGGGVFTCRRLACQNKNLILAKFTQNDCRQRLPFCTTSTKGCFNRVCSVRLVCQTVCYLNQGHNNSLSMADVVIHIWQELNITVRFTTSIFTLQITRYFRIARATAFLFSALLCEVRAWLRFTQTYIWSLYCCPRLIQIYFSSWSFVDLFELFEQVRIKPDWLHIQRKAFTDLVRILTDHLLE